MSEEVDAPAHLEASEAEPAPDAAGLEPVPALSERPPREIPQRREHSERYLKARRRRNRVAVMMALSLIAAGFVFADRDRGAKRTIAPAAPTASTSVAWSVDVASETFVAVLAEPGGRLP